MNDARVMGYILLNKKTREVYLAHTPDCWTSVLDTCDDQGYLPVVCDKRVAQTKFSEHLKHCLHGCLICDRDWCLEKDYTSFNNNMTFILQPLTTD